MGLQRVRHDWGDFTCTRERVTECVISLWPSTFFWLVVREVIGSQHHHLSSSNQSGVSVFVSSIQLTSSTWWGFQCQQNSSRIWFRILSLAFEKKLKVLDFTIIILSCLNIFLCFCIFPLFWLHFFSGTQERYIRLIFFLHYKWQAGNTVEAGSVLGRPQAFARLQPLPPLFFDTLQSWRGRGMGKE